MQISSQQKQLVNSEFNSMTDDEKLTWKKAIEECIAEIGGLKTFRFDVGFIGFGIACIIVGVKIESIELCLIGALTIGALAALELTEGSWGQIIKCAKDKKDKNAQKTDEPIAESKTTKKILISEKQYKNLFNLKLI